MEVIQVGVCDVPLVVFFFFQAEDGIRDKLVTGVQTCALPISTRQAKCAAENIAAAIRGGAKRDFSFKALGKMGSLGHHSAVAEVFGMKLSGFLAWGLWRTIYLMKVPGPDLKLPVATAWTLGLILSPD